jgi:hypothetical protein
LTTGGRRMSMFLKQKKKTTLSVKQTLPKTPMIHGTLQDQERV